MTARLKDRFAQCKREGRTALVTYVMAGDPDAHTCDQLLEGLPAAGADIIELGMPFSDPMADGPTIQRAAERALKAGMSLAGTLRMAARWREKDSQTPLVLMGYLNPILAYGQEAFIQNIAHIGVDGLIIVDLPVEEDTELREAAAAHTIPLIRLTSPNTDEARAQIITRNAQGFIYHVSVLGITGTKSAEDQAVAAPLARLRALTDLPIAVGFGIKTPQNAKAIARHADAVVVGSILIDALTNKGIKAALTLTAHLKDALAPSRSRMAP
ncbi:MAG: tryptophan synthase subunit alpha [Pseudomonadota bacterium]